jgi:YfiH family protein
VADVLRSAMLSALGVAHGFNLRTSGTSEGAYAWQNLGRSVGDVPERVEENHRRFAAEVGYAYGTLYETSQVHGAAVHVVAEGSDVRQVRAVTADALVAPPGVAIGVRVADCVPVLLVDTHGGAVAAVHAGWRGTVRGVVEAGVRALLHHGAGDPRALRAAVLPHIRRCCFEVGDDVALELLEAMPGRDPSAIDRSRAKPHVDLTAIVRAKLRALGVPDDAIDDVAGCTRCEPERFFSFRRDGKQSGRHLAAIVSR